MSELTVPREWAKINISDIADVDLGKTPKKKDYISDGLYKVIKFRDVGYKGIDWSKNKDGFVPEDATKDLKKLELDAVLITASAHSSEHIGRKICFVNEIPKNYKNVFYCGELLGIMAYKDILNPKFVFLYFLSHSGYKEIQSRVKGVHLTSGQARNMAIPFASYEEQGQIVDIIEQLFSDLDNAIDNLKKVKDQLKIYRQSVLKYAFEGKLVDVDDGWLETTLSAEFEIVMGQSPESKHYNRDGEGLPFFQGKKEFTKLYAEVEVWSREATKLAKKGDVLLSVRAPIGPVNLAPAKCGIGRGLAAIKPNQKTESKLLLYLLKSLEIELEKRGTGTTFRAITKPRLYSVPIRLPVIKEGRNIVLQEIESRFSVSDKMEETIENSLKQAEALRQSILKQAFEGKLTEGWRKNNPELISGENSAKALLKKIKAEREALENTRKRKR